MSIEGSAMSIVVDPSAPEAFTPRELTNADKDFTQRVPQYLDAETGIKASAYGYGERVLIVYEESGEGIVILIQPSAWNKNSRKFISKILHSPAPIPLKSPSSGTPHSPAPVPLVTPMYRYARSWILSDRKLRFAVAIIPEGRSDPCPHSS